MRLPFGLAENGMRHDAERLRARASGSVGPEDHPLQLAELARRAQRQQGGALVPVVHQLEAALAALAQANDLIVGQGGMAAVDMADDVGVGLQHHVLVDEARAGDRRAAGMDRAVEAMLARPGHHLARGRAVLDSP